MTKTYPNEDETTILKMRFEPGGRLYAIHPKSLQIEKALKRHGGKMHVKICELIDRYGTYYHGEDAFNKVHDTEIENDN